MTEVRTGWGSETLGTLTQSTRPICYGVLKPGEYNPDGVPLVRIVDIKDDVLDLGGVHRISPKLDEEFRRSRLNGGEILLSIQGTIGRVATTSELHRGANISRTIAVIEPDGRVLINFCAYWLRWKASTSQFKVTGTTRDSLNIGELRSMKCPLPQIDEQERIVEILEEQFSRLDSALASIRVVREKAAVFRRSLLHAAFGGELTGGAEGWREVTLADVCDYVRGVTYGKSDATDKPANGFLPLLRATNIEERRIVLSDFVYVPEAKVKPVQLLRKGDLVMAASSGSIQVVGKSGPVPEGFTGTFGAFCAVLRPTNDSNHQFLNYFVSSPMVREAWSAAARGTNINNLKREDVLGTPMPLPPLAEQERIVSVLEEQFSRLDIAMEVANQLEARIASERRSLLHAAFTGQLTALWRESHV